MKPTNSTFKILACLVWLATGANTASAQQATPVSKPSQSATNAVTCLTRMSHEGKRDSASASPDSWLTDTFWFVPALYLPALVAINTGEPRIVTVQDQTVWHFTNFSNGYLSGISATNIGFGWSYMLIVGSVTPDCTVKLSFSPRGELNSADPATQSITIGDGTLLGDGAHTEFLMQMTSGTPALTLSHWARMREVTPADPEWSSLPGYLTTGVSELTGLQTSILYK